MQFITHALSLSPKTVKRFIFIMGLFGIAFFLFCDFGSYNNWFNCRDVVYLRTEKGAYTWAQLMYNSDEYFLLMALTLAFWKATQGIKLASYLSALIVDLMLAGMWCCYKYNPEWGEWDLNLWVYIAIGLFISKLVLYYSFPKLWILKLF